MLEYSFMSLLSIINAICIVALFFPTVAPIALTLGLLENLILIAGCLLLIKKRRPGLSRLGHIQFSIAKEKLDEVEHKAEVLERENHRLHQLLKDPTNAHRVQGALQQSIQMRVELEHKNEELEIELCKLESQLRDAERMARA